MKYLGIDWGLKKIGFAFSEGFLASPLETIRVQSLKEAVESVRKEIVKTEAEKIVIGMPEGDMGKRVLKAIQELKKLKIPIEIADETLSTRAAKEKLLEIGLSRKKRREDDAVSASIILQNWLDEKK